MSKTTVSLKREEDRKPLPSITDLAFLGYRVLQIMENDPDWGADTLRDIESVSHHLGLSGSDEDAMFEVLVNLDRLPATRKGWVLSGGNVGLLYEEDHVHTFQDFIEVGDPMRPDEEVDEDHPEMYRPHEEMQVWVFLSGGLDVKL